MHINHRETLAFGRLHDVYTPVNIRRIAVLEIKRCTFCNVRAGIESLMAHQHAVLERAPGQTFGHGEMSGTEILSIIIINIGIAI